MRARRPTAITGDATRQGLGARAARATRGSSSRRSGSSTATTASTKGQVAIYFFPTGSAEKAVVEITDGSETFTVLVHGLTGRVELKDGALRDVDDHMLRNAMGDKDAERDGRRSE